ncbi:hypothetical protein MUP42_02280 [Candidatus Bathyarchaeota archaeon]|nr:hypothetical protein [Candidatus Bathyarchaeota archaeon]
MYKKSVSPVLLRPHFRFRKVSPPVLRWMQKLRVGGASYREIADEVGLVSASVQYHLCPEQRLNTLARARRALAKDGKKPKTEREKQYDAEYFKDRYWHDEVFRRKVIEANKKD